MRKKLIRLGLSGFPIGIAIGYVITLIISLCIGDGLYYSVRPELIRTMGSELKAVLLQTLLCGVIGSGFSMATVVWHMDAWSLAKQSVVYFAIACVVMFPLAYVANWMQHSLAGVLLYVGIFVAIFLVIWISQYLVWKRKIAKMNESVR